MIIVRDRLDAIVLVGSGLDAITLADEGATVMIIWRLASGASIVDFVNSVPLGNDQVFRFVSETGTIFQNNHKFIPLIVHQLPFAAKSVSSI